MPFSLTFYVHGEDGIIHTVADSPQVTPRELIRGLVGARVVPGFDEGGRAIHWHVKGEAGEVLDDSKSLVENGVGAGHHLYLHRRLEQVTIPSDAQRPLDDRAADETLDNSRTRQESGVRSEHHAYVRPPAHSNATLRLHLHLEDSSVQTIDIQSDVRVGVMIQDLVRARIVSDFDEWTLEDRDAERVLDNSQTLEENGVHNGHRLYFKRHVKHLGLQIQTAKGEMRSLTIAAKATREQLIDEAERVLGFSLDHQWVRDGDTGRLLAAGKMIEEEGVLDGHHLEVRQQRSPVPWILAACGLGLLTALGYWVLTSLFISVEMTTVPPGAAVQINGKQQYHGVSPLRIRLRSGAYEIAITKGGYETVSKAVEVKRGVRRFDIVLVPLALPDLKLSGDIVAGSARIDETALSQGEGGTFEQRAISKGDHAVSLSTTGGQVASFVLTSVPGALPVVGDHAVAESLLLFLVSSWSGQTHVQVFGGSPQPVPGSVQVDGSPAVELSAAGDGNLSLPPGASHTLTFRLGSQQWPVQVDDGPAPALTVFIASLTQPPTPPQRASLTIEVTPPLDGVQVLVNEKPRGSTIHGKRTLRGLPAGSYTVRIADPGYQVSPPKALVSLSIGANKTLPFSLSPLPPATGILQIKNIVPGSRALLNGKLVGVVDATGVLQIDQLHPGLYTIRLERYEYQTWQDDRSVSAGQPQPVEAHQLRVYQVLLNFAPKPTKITYARDGDAQSKSVGPDDNGRLWLLPGSYTFIAYWNGNPPCSKHADVGPRPNDMPLTLSFHPKCD